MSKEAVKVEETVEIPVEELVEEVIERPYTLRRFKDGDMFPLLKILKKIGIGECKDAFVQAVSGKSVEEVGIDVAFDIVGLLIENLSKVETEIYALYADMAGITVDDIKEMEFGTLPMMIVDSFSEVKNTSFFKVLAKLL
ncbi:MAG: hypothetical protein IJZ23_06875 [Roseburia sp.]|nr:hypothetical protein [Roseburia sp.]MBQ8279548.1 hypothetical protein [Roseburia sp.]